MATDKNAAKDLSQPVMSGSVNTESGRDPAPNEPEVPLPPDDEAPVEEELIESSGSTETTGSTVQDVPAHSTEAERERLKDFNKGGIPPGSC